jgi:hypothetical protein
MRSQVQYLQATWPSQRLPATSSVPDFTGAFSANGVIVNSDVNVDVDVDDNQMSDDIAQDEYGFAYFNHNTSSETRYRAVDGDTGPGK